MVYDVESANLANIKESVSLLKRIVIDLEYMEEKNKKYYSGTRSEDIFFDYIIDEDSEFFICKEKETQKIVGLLLCYLYQPVVTNKNYKRAQDEFLQPDPSLNKKERSKIFLQLLKAYEEWATKKGAKEIFFGVNIKNDIRKSMKRRGYEMADFVMKKEVSHG